MVLPNFLVIGAQKAGTTALYYYLNQHPQIYMSSIKEPGFFAFEGQKPDFRGPGDRQLYSGSITDLAAYQQLFQDVTDETAIGEATTWYLYSPEAPQRIKHYIPEAKLIVVLRNPVDRAYSAFMHARRDERETYADFAQALRAEQTRMDDHWEYLWHYQHMGFYAAQLKRYFELFDRNQIRIYFYEDLNSNSQLILQDICEFLGINPAFTPQLPGRFNVSGTPKIKLLHTVLSQPNAIKAAFKFLVPSKGLRDYIRLNLKNYNLSKPQIPAKVRNELIRLYRDDILELQNLVDRDLSAWLI